MTLRRWIPDVDAGRFRFGTRAAEPLVVVVRRHVVEDGRVQTRRFVDGELVEQAWSDGPDGPEKESAEL